MHETIFAGSDLFGDFDAGCSGVLSHFVPVLRISLAWVGKRKKGGEWQSS